MFYYYSFFSSFINMKSDRLELIMLPLICCAAKYLGLKSPIIHKLWYNNIVPEHDLKYGMNFAYGGTGVFDTFSSGPNMTTQIDSFNQVIQKNVYTLSDITNSIAYVSVAGNDYNDYLAKDGPLSVNYLILIIILAYHVVEGEICFSSLQLLWVVAMSVHYVGHWPVITIFTVFFCCLFRFSFFCTYCF